MPKKRTLEDIDGIGPKLVEKLKEAKIKTVTKLSKQKPEKIAEKVDGVGKATAKKLIALAKKALEEDEKAKDKKKATPKKKTTKAKARPKKSSKLKKKKATVPSLELDELQKEIESPDQQVALGAIGRLGMLDIPKATEILLLALSDNRYMVRIHAAAQLGEKQDKKAIPGLIEALHDSSMFVRQTAAGALENIGGTKAKKAIRKAEKEGLLLDELPPGKRLSIG